MHANLRLKLPQKIFKVLCFSGEAVVSFKTKDLSFLKYDKKEFFLVKEKKGKDTVLSVIYGDSISNKINSNQALISKSVITDFKIIKI